MNYLIKATMAGVMAITFSAQAFAFGTDISHCKGLDNPSRFNPTELNEFQACIAEARGEMSGTVGNYIWVNIDGEFIYMKKTEIMGKSKDAIMETIINTYIDTVVIDQLEARIDELEDEIAVKQALIDTLTDANLDLEDQIATLMTEKADLQTRLDAAGITIGMLQDDKSDLTIERDARVAQINAIADAVNYTGTRDWSQDTLVAGLLHQVNNAITLGQSVRAIDNELNRALNAFGFFGYDADEDSVLEGVTALVNHTIALEARITAAEALIGTDLSGRDGYTPSPEDQGTWGMPTTSDETGYTRVTQTLGNSIVTIEQRFITGAADRNVVNVAINGRNVASFTLSQNFGELTSQVQTAVEAAYDQGYNDGYEDGYREGYADGFADGVNSVQ